jgi:hypothetical protein
MLWIRSLTERVRVNQATQITLNQTAKNPYPNEPVSASQIQPRGQLEIKQISKSFKKIENCKINIKCFAGPNFANLISLESLEIVESIYARISLEYCTKF